MTNDDSLQILDTDATSGLRTLADKTVQVALTSPPFYLLRRYGTSVTWADGWIGELGHEPRPNDFVRHLVQIFDDVWRILRDDGCLWVNLADTFNNKQGKKGTTNAPDGSDGRFAAGGRRYAESLRQQPDFFKHYVPGVGHKSEMGVPFRFHLAMTDPEFRSFICGGQGPQWICRRTVGKVDGEIKDAGGGGKRDAGTNARSTLAQLRVSLFILEATQLLLRSNGHRRPGTIKLPKRRQG